jgi:hypothetical protein
MLRRQSDLCLALCLSLSVSHTFSLRVARLSASAAARQNRSSPFVSLFAFRLARLIFSEANRVHLRLNELVRRGGLLAGR